MTFGKLFNLFKSISDFRDNSYELIKNFHYNIVVFKHHKIIIRIAAIIFCITFYPLNSLVLASDFDITQQRVIESTDQPDQWLVHGRTYSEQRYSPLNQINTETVKNLGIAWIFETDTNRGHEATPIVVDDIMFSTSAWSIVYANDAQTGEMIWKYDPKVPKEKAYFVCCDVVNRGVAVWQGKVFLGTIDGRLIALDAKTGEMIWEKMTVNPTQAYSITGAPRVVKNNVVIGNGGAEFGVRGYVSAYDADTGDLVWRFYTVPGNPEDDLEEGENQKNESIMKLAASTWGGSNWLDFGGGGTVWDSMAYDPELDLLYIGTGNGGPWEQSRRSPDGGDNLFLSSIIALKPDTGEYVWHYQTTPGDKWDYTATQHMILAELEIDGRLRKVIMQAPKNGFFYVIDRTDGKLISAENYVKVTWASHVDTDSGRPVKIASGDYEEELKFIFPGPLGGHNWHPMSYNPNTGLVYIPVLEMYFAYSKDEAYTYDEKLWNTGIDSQTTIPPKNILQLASLVKSIRGRLSAWDPVEQKEVWKSYHTLPWNGGTLTTSGNLVFQGNSDGEFVAFQADTGKRLWSTDLKSGIIAPPITYSIDGQQYVSVLVGWGGMFALYSGLPAKYTGGPINGKIVTFALGSDLSITDGPPTLEMPYPPESNADEVTIANGEEKYHAYCFVCHGVGAVGGGVISDLRYMSEETHSKFSAIVLGGMYANKGMVGFSDILSQEDSEEIHAYLIQRAKETYYLERINSFLK